MKLWKLLLMAVFAGALTCAAFAQGTIHGSGDPTTLHPVPNCNPNRFYVDDSTQKMWQANQGSPCLWVLSSTASGSSSTGSSGAVQGSDGSGAFTDTGVSVSSGNVSVGAGKSVGSADTGTPKFTFSTNLITASKPINAPSITTGTAPSGIDPATALGGTGCTEADNTGWTPTPGTDYERCDSTLHRKVMSNNGAAESPIVLKSDAALLAAGTSASLTAPSQIYVCTSTCTVTPPVPAAGYQFCVFNGDNVSTVITLAALGSSARYEVTARTSYGTAGTGTMVSGGAAKDMVCIVGLDSTHYVTTNFIGTWTVN